MWLLKLYLFLHNPQVRQYAVIFTGCVLSAIGINMFFTPVSLLADGAVGIAGIFYLTLGLPLSVGLILLNVPIFFFLRHAVSRDFLRISLIGFILYTVILESTAGLMAAYAPTQDMFLASLFGGMLNGLGCGMVFRAKASTGGIDLIGVVIKKRYGLEIGTTCFIANAALVLVALVVLNPELAMYTLFSMYVTGILTDRTIDGIDTKKVMLIVSAKYARISEQIITDASRSTTLISAEGGFSGTGTKIVMAVMPMSQVPEVRAIIEKTDRKAFILILDAADVNGSNFRHKKASRYRLIRRFLQRHRGQ